MQPGKAVQTIGILSRPRREQLSVVVPPLLKWLEARGIKPVLDKDTAAAATGGFQGQPAPAVADVSEFLLVLGGDGTILARSEEHTSELQSLTNLVCRLLLEKK